ncbi:MAG: hypothetical protein JWO05_2518 [Gemmatimonadetes bacterium]|nr:hypothetical protein [Gemmatimonadota bacterium]
MSRHIASLVITSAFILSASAHAQAVEGDKTFFDFQVEQAVRVKSVRAPEFPDRLRAMGKEQQVLVQFVVDERGQAQMNTFKVIKSTDGELTESVRRAISVSSFFPAEFQGHKVKQLVQQPFTFKP